MSFRFGGGFPFGGMDGGFGEDMGILYFKQVEIEKLIIINYMKFQESKKMLIKNKLLRHIDNQL